MYKGQVVAVVVPAYNESGLVGSVIETIPSFVDRVYVVDDCSTDDTWDEIRRHARRVNSRSVAATVVTDGGDFDERVVTLRNERNRGVGYCVTRGYRHALADGADVVAVMNGDGQMDPAVLDRIIDPVVSGAADYAKGNRLSRPDDYRDMSRWRRFGNRLLTLLTRVASGYWSVTDSQNGYTAISREALETIPLDDLYERYGFLNDLLVTLNVYGLRIADVPHSALYGNERSGIRYGSFVPTLSLLLLRDFVWRLKEMHLTSEFRLTPIFYAVGVSGLLFGGLLSVATLPSLIVGGTTGTTGRVGLAGIVVGLVSSALAVLSDAWNSRSLQIDLDE
jgi:glycosyltransferase involved in cell wall biosynthesis